MAVNKAKKRPITNEIMTAQNDITLSYIGKVLLNPDKVLTSESGGKGVEIYEDMLFEARVFSEMQKRKLAVIGKEWDVEPASDDAQDVKVADFIKEVFKKFSYDTARQALLSGIVTGFKPAEVMWDYSEGDIWIKSLNGGSPRRFVFDLEGNLRLLTWKNMIEGEEIPDRKFIVFRNPSNNSSPYGDALGRALYWPVWFKKNGVKFWAVFLDKFGQPTPWGKYPPGTKSEDQTKLLNSLKAMQTDQAVITPDNVAIDLLEAARASSVDSYDKWEKFWNDAITFIILGQTASTEGTPGKLGSEEARTDIRDEIVKADADLLSECQNDFLIPWICDYNFPGLKAYPKVWVRTEPPEDLEKISKVHQAVLPWLDDVPKSFIHDTYSIPVAEGGEDVLVIEKASPGPFGFTETTLSSKQKAVSSKKSLPPGLLHSAYCRLPSSFAELDDWVSFYMEQLSPSLKKIKASALGEIEDWLRMRESAPSEKEFIAGIRNILGDSYKKIDPVAVTEAVSGIYQAAKNIGEVGIGFGGPDIRAINFLGNLDHFYLSKFIDNPDAQAALEQFLKERYLEGGEGLFGRGDPKTIAEMKNLLSQKLTDLEGYQVKRIADTGVVRAQNWAHISQLHDGAIAEIEIVEPTQECPFCAAMDGKIISVPVAFDRMMKQAAMTAEEYEEELRTNQPEWDDALKNFNVEDFVDQGLLPPYHPHCRGTIIKRIGQGA